MKILNTLLLTLLLTGCQTPQYNLQHTNFRMIIQESPEYLDRLSARNRTVYGMSFYSENVCVIILREYPKCLLHEVRHCIEGNWHEGRDTLEDC